MRSVRLALGVVLDVAVWSLAVWLLTAPAGQLSPRAWHHTATACRTAAYHFGLWALMAERNYWRAVRT